MKTSSPRPFFHGSRIDFFLYAAFVVLLGTMFFVLASYDFLRLYVYSFLVEKFTFINSHSIEKMLQEYFSNENALSKFLERVSLALPFVWLASHVNGVINKRKKLSAEYEHKKIVMEFYVDFNDQIENNSILKEAFVKSVTDVITRFPSTIGEAQESASPMGKVLNTIKGKDKNLEKNIKNLVEYNKDAT